VAAGLAPVVLANHPAASPYYGTAVHEGRADYTITLDSGTRWVNVTGGETVRFVMDGKSFMWRFDTYGSLVPVFELKEIAPAGILGDRAIKVYVSPDPRYLSGVTHEAGTRRA
jgi:hypothetical protein